MSGNKKSQRQRSNRNPQNALLVREINILKAAYLKLAGAMETNTRVFSEAFQMADAQIHVMQRALSDMSQDRAYKTHDINKRAIGGYRVDETGIDFSQYLMEYWSCLSFAAFVGGLRALAEAREKTAAANQAASEEGVYVFGGA